MNTTQLKRFAQETRIRLLEAVSDKLNYLLNTDSVQLRDYAAAIDQLRKDVARMGQDVLVDKVAYTWFNRLMALRFMDANDYQPLQLKVISPIEGHTQPEILNEASQGRIPEELKVDRQRINDLLDGRINVANPQNEVYRMLLIASCNHLHGLFPFLFEQINDYTELLLPDLLLSELSIINDFIEGMTVEDCQEVEIMGWLYQFYISERNDELISSKKTYKKDELAPASQLFTPKWIVQYMVDNTLGQVWSEMSPNTNVIKDLEYYITPDYKDNVSRPQKPIEEIKFFEPCVGSGHILAYAFDVYYKMYEEAGYNPSEIPFLILKHNLYGVDIDPRATQIASFTLLMKAREKNRRFFKKIEQYKFTPNILYYEDFEEDPKFNNATVLGSLIRVTEEETQSIEIESNTLFAERQQKLKELYKFLSTKYDVVVTNPPYINSSRMEPTLKEYVNSSFPDTKSDLFACFVLRNLELTNEDGLTGYMTPFVWMFISSYQKLREIIIENHFINNLIQLEYSGFDGATVPICTFTLRNKPMNAKGSYIRLSDFRGSENQAPKTLEAIQNPDCGWYYIKNQKDFKKIPGNNIGYWLSENMLSIFSDNKSLEEIGDGKQGLATADNGRFLRFWSEVSQKDYYLTAENLLEAKQTGCKWFPYNKAGQLRKWYGNQDYLVNWENDGCEIKNFKDNNGKLRSRPQNTEWYFKESISWGLITSAGSSFRLYPNGFIYDVGGMSFFPYKNVNKFNLLGSLNSKLISNINNLLNPTINLQIGDVIRLPFLETESKELESDVQLCISISRQEWNSRETSWDFEENELIRLHGQDLEEAIDLYRQYWTKQFIELHQNEEELNRQFIEIYGLEEDLDPNVPLEDITILRDELKQTELKEISNSWQSGWELKEGNWGHSASLSHSYPELPFDEKELVMQFISYAVGLMMGRYSLDKPGLILANQGETLSDFIEKVDKPKEELSFVPDADNIIPVLDSEWFSDDIVTQFREIVKAVWGKSNLQRNIEYIERALGKPLRAYFYRDFYNDHIKRYKRRPIYWMIASPSGAFQVLIYMHRYHADTLNNVLNDYLRPYIEKLENHIEHLNHVAIEGSAREITQAKKEITNIEKTVDELRKYDKEVLYPLATNRITIDLDDGVLVNYNRFGNVVKGVSGLNDKKTKDNVKKFDWIDTKEIR